jgi:hypothetical protein
MILESKLIEETFLMDLEKVSMRCESGISRSGNMTHLGRQFSNLV